MPISRRIAAALTAAALAVLPTTAPASPKPCRDAHGRVIPCVKRPARTPAPRKRDDAGRFAHPAAAGATHPADEALPSAHR